MLRRFRNIATVGGVLTALSVTLLPSTALGLGNNRPVQRSCGTNYVSSGYVGSRHYSWAQTQRQKGNCAGPLRAGLQYAEGFRYVVRGTATNAYASMSGLAKYGVHWGCDSCNITYS